jgi:transcriptional regulator with XRE-family HTH domain
MNLEQTRKAKGFTQTELDEKAGLTKGTVSDIERGKNRRPSWEVVKRIAETLGSTPEELFPIHDISAA